jgi:hypothetical protein
VHNTITALVAEDATTAHAVTITIPTRRHGTNDEVDAHLGTLLADAKAQLEGLADTRTAEILAADLEAAVQAVDRRRLSAGLWAAATDRGAHVHLLDDPTEPSVTVGERLDLLPLVRQARHVRDALVLTISEPGARLYRYHGDAVDVDSRFEEIDGYGLPLPFPGEEARRGRETGSWQRDERYRRWLRDIDAAVTAVRKALPAVVELPTVAVGIGRYLAFYGEVAPASPFDLAVERSPEADTLAELDEHVAAALDGHADQAATAAVARLDGARSANRLAAGVDDVAAAAAEGRGQTLIVEDTADDRMLAVVGDVYRFGGQVCWTRAGTLGDRSPAALITRW